MSVNGTSSISRILHLLPGALVLWMALVGCDKATPTEVGEEPPEPPDARRLEALRALPYAGGYPADEEEETGVVFRDPERSCPGYSLYAIHALCDAELIDEEGRVINSWSHRPRRKWTRAELLPNGDLLVVGTEPGADRQDLASDVHYVIRFNWNGKILWKRELLAHHDIEVTPAGKLLVLTFQRKLMPQIHPRIETRDEQLTLLEPNGSLIESRSLLEAAAANPDVLPLDRVKPTAPSGIPWMDIFHSNSAEWMRHPRLVGKHPLYDLDNVLICSRRQDCIAVVNWTRNEIVWAWGRGEIIGPHDAQVLENGHILLFDNGLGREYSRAVELDPVTEKVVWQYVADPPGSFYSATRGSVQRLPNGNTLLAESDKGRAFEVTPDGSIVWEFICPYRNGPDERAAIVSMRRFSHKFVQSIIDNHAERADGDAP
jgi:hypothetical protein